MMVVMKSNYSKEELSEILEKIRDLGFTTDVSYGRERTVIGIVGDVRSSSLESLSSLDGVEKVIKITKPFKLTDSESIPHKSNISVSGISFDSGSFNVIAGPCAIETEELSIEIAREVKAHGAKIFRGGAFKPRTSPYSYQGLGVEGLKILANVREEVGIPVVTEVMDVRDLDEVCKYVDMLQIGARNMQNFGLLKEIGKLKFPVILKRSMMASIEEWIMAAEYILIEGNKNVVLCERGIRTYEVATRNTLDLSAVACVKTMTDLPVIVDPSHATGRWDIVMPMVLAGMAAGADGAMIEVHPYPDRALSDGAQSLKYDMYEATMKRLKEVAVVFDRRV